jgi:hypothetical protein
VSRSPRGPWYRLTKAEAEAEAARIGGTVKDVSYDALIMPDTFWFSLAASTQPAMALIREQANKYYGGNLESAWNDACEGAIRGVRPDVCVGIDERLRTKVRLEEWQIVPPAVPLPPEVRRSGGSYSDPSGDPLRDAATRASEAYACGDSWSDE